MEAGKPAEAKPEDEDKQVTGAKLHLEEEREKGEIGWPVYSTWFKAVQSWSLLAGIAATLTLGQLAAVASSLWLAFWSQDAYGLSQGAYMGIYGGEYEE